MAHYSNSDDKTEKDAKNRTSRQGEFELIRWIQNQMGNGDGQICGIGDDCAVEKSTGDQLLLTSKDLLIEDVHFRRNWTSMYDLGRKSVAVNLSDIAAMGGEPQSLFLGIGSSRQLPSEQVRELIRGFIAEAKAYGVVLAGGDTCGSPGPLIISVTVHGTVAAENIIRRVGAAVGDSIYVSGTLGDSALALQLLQTGQCPADDLAVRLHTPKAQVALGKQLAMAGWVSSMLDISDGLLADLTHLLEASDVGADIHRHALPLSAAFCRACAADAGLIDLALAGGEDYELLFTSPYADLDKRLAPKFKATRIGTICQQRGIRIYLADGTEYRCGRQGFDHFASV